MGGPSIPPKGNIHGGPMLQITQKSIYRAKKLTPDVYLPRVESNRVNRNPVFVDSTEEILQLGGLEGLVDGGETVGRDVLGDGQLNQRFHSGLDLVLTGRRWNQLLLHFLGHLQPDQIHSRTISSLS